MVFKFVLLSLWLSVAAFGADVGKLSGSAEDREKTYSEVLEERSILCAQLIRIAGRAEAPLRLQVGDSVLNTNVWHEDKHLAILLLGELKCSEAVPILFQNLTYKNPRNRSTEDAKGPDWWYPAVESLIKIGIESVDHAIRMVETESIEPLVQENIAVILRDVLGKDIAKERLMKSISITNDPVRRERLTRLLNVIN